jgi:hypothetical protein
VEIGDGWAMLEKRLDEELRRLDPPGELVRARVDSSGLLRFDVRLAGASRDVGRDIVRHYEQLASGCCEACGGQGSIRAGVVIRVICDDCLIKGL